jgi:hypothetical protein
MHLYSNGISPLLKYHSAVCTRPDGPKCYPVGSAARSWKAFVRLAANSVPQLHNRVVFSVLLVWIAAPIISSAVRPNQP